MKQTILMKNDCYKQNRPLTPKGIMLHSVGCAQPKASIFVRSWNKANCKKAVHAFIDANDGEVYQTLPWVMRGWHAGGEANNSYIGVEMCEPDAIKYGKGASFEVIDETKAKRQAKTAYESAVKLFALLCKQFNIKPSNIISHSEGHKMGIASGHVDPEHLWKGLGLNYTMDIFRNDVVRAIGDINISEPAKVEQTPIVKPTVTNDDIDKNISKIIWDKLIKAGFSKTGVAGLMGNLYAESGFRSNNLQNSFNKKFNVTDEQYTEMVDKGSYLNFVHDGAGYGLAQWTFKTRKEALLKFARGRSVSIGDLNMQIDFLIEELKGYKTVYQKLKLNYPLYDQTKIVLTGFEKPADQSENVVRKRLTYATKCYNINVSEHMYRVRKSWTDTGSQKGAFKSLSNAKNLAIKHGLNVYDENGALVFKS